MGCAAHPRGCLLWQRSVAGDDGWLESADAITHRSDIEVRPYGMITIPPGGCLPDKPVPPAAGEALRSHHDPSVSELLIKRAKALATTYPSGPACRMALMAYRWDREGSRPALQSVQNLDECRRDGLIAAARADLGDEMAVAEWAAAFTLDQDGFGISPYTLSILWLVPGNAILEMTVERLFVRSGSPLSPEKRPDLVTSALLTVPQYRAAVLAALQNRAVQDKVALALSAGEGFPRFAADWPEDRKAAAIHEMESLLHTREIKAFPARMQDTECMTQKVYLAK
jgi:hypothetical protein